MNKRMLIDGTHPEEVRVVIADGNRLEEYDIESATKSQLKGNIYLAKVMRVEPPSKRHSSISAEIDTAFWRSVKSTRIIIRSRWKTEKP
jgi:hypothetical protein